MKKHLHLAQSMDMSISFSLRTSFKNQKGEHPIQLRLLHQGVKREVSTGLSILKEHWLPIGSCVKESCKQHKTYNAKLQEIAYQARELFQMMKHTLVEFHLDELIERLKGKDAPPETLMEYMHNRIESYKGRIGLDLAQTTFYKYQRTERYLQEFLESSRKLKNIPVSRVDTIFLDDFYKFLRREKNNSQNTSVSLMHCLKSILHEPVKKGVIRVNPFQDFKMSRVTPPRGYLTMEEIRRFQSVTGLSRAMARNRDIFVFACYTGLAYSDIASLRANHIIEDQDGSFHIEKYRQKTNVLSYIPLLPVALDILRKYSPTGHPKDFRWYVMHNFRMNQAVKEIAAKAGIKKDVFMHLARHSFATTIALGNGVPIETVGKMLGHAGLKHTMVYAKVVNEKVKRDMKPVMEAFKAGLSEK